MKTTAEIILVENSTAGNAPRRFMDQLVEITSEPDTIITGADGQISVGSHPWTVLWSGGTVGDLQNMTDVKIVGRGGEVLVDGELNTTTGVVREVAKGVKFSVSKRY